MKEQQYSAPSPYDHNPTEPIGNRLPLEQGIPARQPDEVEEAGTPRPIANPLHEHAYDASFKKAELLFDPRNPHRIEFYDTSLIERNQLKDELSSRPFTHEELAEQPEEDNPFYTELLQARQKLDTLTVPLRTRFNMDGPKRRSLKKDRQTAQDVFESARNAYIENKLPSGDSMSVLAVLTAARVHLAETTFAVRQGSLTTNKKATSKLEDAQELYGAARALYFEDQLAIHSPGLTKDEKRQLRASLSDHERGALAGEEANHYLTEVNDTDKKSYFRKLTDRYNKLGRKSKIAAGITAVALSGIGFGAIGGFAAVGGVAAVKFGRNYLNGEAARLKDANDTRTQQEASVLHAGTLEDTLVERTLVKESRRHKETLITTTEQSFDEQHHTATLHEGARVSNNRRKVVGKAALFTALPFVGGAAGALLEHAVPAFSHGVFRENGIPRFKIPGFSADEHQPDSSTGSDIDTGAGPETPNPTDTQQESPPSPLAPESQPDTTPVSPRQTYLYDTYAGQSVEVTIPTGGSVWREVAKNVALRQPGTSYFERERITGNIVNELLRQNPTINADAVSVGQRFSVKISS